MTNAFRLESRRLDMVTLLHSTALIGAYRGDEAWQAIQERMETIPADSTLAIDIRRANPLRYEFCQHAYGPLMKALIEGRWSQKFVVFQLQDYHRQGFFRGILKHLGIELPRKESEGGFVAAGFYAKLIVGDEEAITFVGNLSEAERLVLDAVDEHRVVSAQKVVEELHLSNEKVVEALNSLVKKFFVLAVELEIDQISYFSFNNMDIMDMREE